LIHFPFYFILFYFILFFYGTIVKIPELLHTEPLGKPALDVGIFVIERLFTKVAQTLFAVILEPTIIAQAQLFVKLDRPAKTPELSPEAVLQ
jgi:hypothetical protein